MRKAALCIRSLILKGSDMLRQTYTLTLLCLMYSGAILAATPAGTLIRNQALASYTDTDGNRVSVSSNTVETLIQQVAGVDLASDQSQRAAPGTQVRFSHRVSNTGNTSDRFNIIVSNAGGSINLIGLNVYADADEDGLADSTTAIAYTPLVDSDNDFMVVVQGVLPASGIDGDTASITISASSELDPTQLVLNQDTVTVGIGATVTLRKTISQLAGLSPSGTHRITLRYENTGDEAAGDLALIDALPTGMNYVTGSAMWTESSETLTDADPADTHAGSNSSIVYCAYHASCQSLFEAELDADNSSVNQVSAVIDLVAAGASGELSFDITIDSGLTAGFLQNTAEYEYDIAIGRIERQLSNSVSFEVLASAGVVANGSATNAINGVSEPVSIVSVNRGGVLRFTNSIWNTGNSLDTFNVDVDALASTFPAGTIWQLLRSDGSAVLTDTNNDGVVDTGPIAPGAFVPVVVQLQLPGNVSGNNAGLGFDLHLWAHSVTDVFVSDDVVDHLDEIIGNVVDLTNQAAAGSAGALGVGPGPETTPVSTVPVDVNGRASVDLYIRHQGSEPDAYQLYAYADAVGAAIPDGWQVSFMHAQSQASIVSTGVLASGAVLHVIAHIQLPAGIEPGLQSIWFGVSSANTGASDIKHDALNIAPAASLNLVPGLSAQLEPGASVFYEHVLVNNGNTAIHDVVLLLTDSRPDWISVVYLDSNEDGAPDSADQIFTAPLSLNPGESIDLFVKVFAPANAASLQRNTTTLTALWQSGGQSVQVQDQSTIDISHVHILKEQAVDTACDGVPDNENSFGTGQIEVVPGNNCVVYRLSAHNQGVEPSYNVKIHDYTPPYTVYMASAVCSRTPCWVVEPQPGEVGAVNAETDQLLPGDSFFLQFVVRIE